MEEKKNRVASAGKWGLGVSSAALIFAAQTKQEDAVSNISGWLEWIGVDRMPATFAATGVDTWVTIFGVLGLFMTGWWMLRRSQRKRVIESVRKIFPKHFQAETEAVATCDVAFIPGPSAPDNPARSGITDQLIATKARSNEKAIEQRLSQVPWMPLDDAIRYLAHDSEWGAGHNPNDPLIPTYVGQALHDALLCGDLGARGRKYHVLRGGIKKPPLHPLEPIPAEFWRDARLDAYWPLQGRVQMIASHGAENVARKGDHEGMHDIRLDKSQVEALWPPDQPGAPSDLIPFIQLRELASEYGIALPRFGKAQNNAYHLEGALQQAAVRGLLAVEGRQFRGPVRHNDPLVPIPAKHFREYGFGHGVLGYDAANEASHTGNLRMLTTSQRGIPDVTFYDLHLSESDAVRVLRDFAGSDKNERP